MKRLPIRPNHSAGFKTAGSTSDAPVNGKKEDIAVRPLLARSRTWGRKSSATVVIKKED